MRRKGAEMCWMCDHPEATAEEYLDEVYGIMLMHGWAVQHVECERRPFAYTVGLTRRGLPELVVTGLSPRRGQRLLNIAARRARSRLHIRTRICIVRSPSLATR